MSKNRLNRLKAGQEPPKPEESKRLIEENTNTATELSRGRGRPPADHDRIRFTTMIQPQYRDLLKLIALKEGKQISDVFEEAVMEYINRYEQTKGGKLTL